MDLTFDPELIQRLIEQHEEAGLLVVSSTEELQEAITEIVIDYIERGLKEDFEK